MFNRTNNKRKDIESDNNYNNNNEIIEHTYKKFKNEEIVPQINTINIQTTREGDIEQLSVGKSELLFWKIFRNKVLFNYIFSNFNERSYGYHDITTNLKYLFEKYSNATEIILDKIKSNNNNLINNKYDLELIITKVYKDNKDTSNRSFYNSVYIYYSSKKPSSIKRIHIKNKEYWVKILIIYSNVVALDEYIKLFNIDRIIIQSIFESLFKSGQFKSINYEKLKIFNYLKSNNYIEFNHNQSIYNNILDSDLLSLNIQLNRLIKTQQTIVHELYNNKDNNNNKLYKLISELNQINFKDKFKKEDLKSSIISILESKLIDYYFKMVSKSSNNTTSIWCINGITVENQINSNIGLNKSTELLDYYFNNYKDSSVLLFQSFNEKWPGLDLSILEHYENLMYSIGRKIDVNFLYNQFILSSNHIHHLSRAIQKTSIYNFQTSNNFFLNQIVRPWHRHISYQDSIISFLSSIQLKETIFKFLFNNISKESIVIRLEQYSYSENEQIQRITISLTSTIFANDITGKLGDKGSFDFINEKPKSIEFETTLDLLMCFLYYLNRSDDIIYIFNEIPKILSKFPFKKPFFNFYNICSIYYLELFINYFINNNNNKTTTIMDHLFFCLGVAAQKGYISLFKKLISTPNHNDYLFNIKSTPNSPPRILLLKLVKKSIGNNRFELSNLLIKSINFSKKEKDLLKTRLINKINKK